MISREDQAWSEVTIPSLVVHPKVARHNIGKMAKRARQSAVRLRPHFKTHQSPVIGRWFEEEGIDAITVSSVTMAKTFADAGWRDITIAFPLNVRELDEVARLAAHLSLHVLLEREDVAHCLAAKLKSSVGVWLELDAGYGRSGLAWNDDATLLSLAHCIQDQPHLRFEGLLTHTGHTYRARGRTGILTIFEQTLHRMQHAKSILAKHGIAARLSIGDTPSCSVAGSFTGVDEIRPGNFVFYDLQQLVIGSCGSDDLALAVACPVVATYPERGMLILYGGAVHLSKDYAERGGIRQYGAIVEPTNSGWSAPVEGAFVASVSQEHGIVMAPPTLLERTRVGDLMFVLPAHACLAVDALRTFRTPEGHTL
jgi:D-serine deaminase-like pyridoxal phosphate-dependent protein